MRNFSKTLISMAAVMAVGSAMAAGAMAAELTNINYADNAVTFGGVTPGKSQYTLLVVQGTTAEGATEVTYDANESTIKQIDQNDAGVAFTSAVVGELKDGSYKIMVGNNDGTVDSGILTVSSVVTDGIKIGDIDDSGRINAGDVTSLSQYLAYYRGTEYGNERVNKQYNVVDSTIKVRIGDIDESGRVNAGDVTSLSQYLAYYRGAEYGNATVNTPYTIIIPN